LPAAAPATPPQLLFIPYGEDALQRLAAQILQDQQQRLPDLSHMVVLLPATQAANALRRHLLQAAEGHGHPALLGPEISTLGDWVRHQPGSEHNVLSPHQRELMLVEALLQHPSLYGEGSPWSLADSLLELFDDMSANSVSLPGDLEAFMEQLASAYGLPGTDHPALFEEARLVHTLWHAWHQQLQSSQLCDGQTDYLLKLSASLQRLPTEGHIYLAGFSRLSPAEASWLRQLMAQRQARLLLQGAPLAADLDYHPDATLKRLLTALDVDAEPPQAADAYGHCLWQAFDVSGSPLRERARQTAQRFPASPLAPRLRVFAAGSAEEEARAVDLQTRRWLLAGRGNIGIVTENRRLARRVRALLERAGIVLQDAAGWALSTTSAAAVLERWLQTVEEEFAHQPLLDLLKSPFLWPAGEREARLASVYRFEQGIVLKENVARDLARYRSHLRYRQQRLTAELAADYEPIYSLLDHLETAAAPLRPLLDGRTHAPAALLAALRDSLERLGLQHSLAEDDAGRRLLEELQQMQAAVGDSGLRMSWLEFRAWLGRTLERYNFQPPAQTGQVQLLGLGQSALCRFDALIIAGAEREYLPGAAAGSPFFNDGVRAALGLDTTPLRQAQRFYQFRCLLEAAQQVLITRRQEQDGEEVVASPWLEALQSFHRMAYDDDLQDHELAALVAHPDTQVSNRQAPLPVPEAAHPGVTVPAELLPDSISATGYQQLVNCPYQFFAGHCLGLEPPEAIREMLEKSDYGERVHRCLQAFHSAVAGLPGPFPEPVTATNRAAAVQCLEDIAHQVFAKDLEDNFLHRAWLKRWRDLIPGYIDWQIQRAQQWQVRDTELRLEAAATRPALKGRLDRLDGGPAGMAVIDYKTGHTPSAEEVADGEAVQLPFYAWLAETAMAQDIAQVEYLALDGHRVKALGTLEGPLLEELKRRNAERLEALLHDLNAGAALPAWGDEGVCARCHMAGVCRQQTWGEE
jgi:ATP-dependent helicase/nuclease subunit B